MKLSPKLGQCNHIDVQRHLSKCACTSSCVIVILVSRQELPPTASQEAIKQSVQRLFTLRCKEDPGVAPRNQCTCLTTQQHGSYPIRALSSPCFLFFRPLLLASSWMRVYGGEMICSSSPTWGYMSRNISASPGNTKGGAGWRSCRSWF